jgi:hypothetical protein
MWFILVTSIRFVNLCHADCLIVMFLDDSSCSTEYTEFKREGIMLLLLTYVYVQVKMNILEHYVCTACFLYENSPLYSPTFIHVWSKLFVTYLLLLEKMTTLCS